MKIQPQIIFRDIDAIPETRDKILRHISELDRMCNSITRCRVLIAMPHLHHRSGNRYQIRIDLKAPDREITASHETLEHAKVQDLDLAVRDTFDAVRRKLEYYIHRRRRQAKKHSGLRQLP